MTKIKLFVAFVFVLFNGALKSQDTLNQINKESIIETDDYVNTKKTNDKIVYFDGKYFYKDQRYGESKIHKILLETKDNKIITLVMEAKRNKRMQYIGFIAIPLGIVSTGSALVALVIYPSDPGLGKSIVAVAAVSGVMGIAAPILSASFKTKRTQCNTEAVRLFNERY